MNYGVIQDDNDIVLIKQPPEVKYDATVSIIVVSCIVFMFMCYIVYSVRNGDNDTIFNRVKNIYGSSFSQLSVGIVIAYLVSDLVSTFNRKIVLPVVSSSFPNENVWNTGVELPRGQIMYPGLFLQSIVSFILSIGILFIISEILNIFSRITNKNIYMLTMYIFIVTVFIILFIWNIKEYINPTEETVVIGYQSPRFTLYNKLFI